MSTEYPIKKLKRLCVRSRLDKALNTLEGILTGVLIDQRLNDKEIKAVMKWIGDLDDLRAMHPFNELIPLLEKSLADRVLSGEERDDLEFVIRNLSSMTPYFDEVTRNLQVLQGVMGGIIADGVITTEERKNFILWLDANSHLRGCYPFDEIESLVFENGCDASGRLAPETHNVLVSFFSAFVAERTKRRDGEIVPLPIALPGVCAIDPEIDFDHGVFCLTGQFAKPKALLEMIIEERGGNCRQNVSGETDYLIVGSKGNPCWAYACYGRKVEDAMQRRKDGQRIIIVHESDFWDKVA